MGRTPTLPRMLLTLPLAWVLGYPGAGPGPGEPSEASTVPSTTEVGPADVGPEGSNPPEPPPDAVSELDAPAPPPPVVLDRTTTRPVPDHTVIPGEADSAIPATEPDRDTPSDAQLPGAAPPALELALVLRAPFEMRLTAARDTVGRLAALSEAARSRVETLEVGHESAVQRLADHDAATSEASDAAEAEADRLVAFAGAALIEGRAALEQRRSRFGSDRTVARARMWYLTNAGEEVADQVGDRQARVALLRDGRATLEAELNARRSALTRAEADQRQLAGLERAAHEELRSARDLVSVGTGVVPGIDDRVLDSYVRAAQLSAYSDPGCGMTWWVLASIGRVESGNAGSRTVDITGRVEPVVIGVALTGRGGTSRITDTDAGALDGDPTYDRAVGPMQFIPGTWERNGTDASGDGVADPHNIFDAAHTAARYLCAAAGDLRVDTEAGFRTAAFEYNHSHSYVDKAWRGGEPYRRIAAEAAENALVGATWTAGPGGPVAEPGGGT